MLKFQDNYTTTIATFEDFILLVYTIVDDLYHQFVPPPFHKDEMWILLKCPTLKLLP